MFSTLRIRLVAWITVVVFVMVAVTNFMVRTFELEGLRSGYDAFLRESVDDVHASFVAHETDPPDVLFAELKEKIKQYEYRNWFLTIVNAEGESTWSSPNSPRIEFLRFEGETRGPFDTKRHRIFTRRYRNSAGEEYYIRCGFPQLVLQEDIDLINRNVLIVGICILLAAPAGGYVIAWRATRPISNIIQTTAELQPSNFHERLPIRGTGDELDQLSLTINGMLDRIASYIHQNRDFIANAAHELRSPLAAIRTSVEVALHRDRTQEEYDTLLTDVMEEVTRLSGLVNRLLLLAEGDAGRTAAAGNVTHLDRVVRESLDMFDGVAEINSILLHIGHIEPAVVPGEETYLRQVVRNLIDNAIKYNRPGGEVVVYLRIDKDRKLAKLSISDSGIGMDAESLNRIFERFYRVDHSRSRDHGRGGYGLGLSICQTIIKSLGGEVTVESVLGEGTTFTVTLPLANPQAPAPKPEIAPPAVAS